MYIRKTLNSRAAVLLATVAAIVVAAPAQSQSPAIEWNHQKMDDDEELEPFVVEWRFEVDPHEEESEVQEEQNKTQENQK